MKKFLVTIAVLGLSFAAHADKGLEVQISNGFAGTAGDITMSDKDFTGGDSNTSWNLGGEVYKSINDNIQIGGILGVADAGCDACDTSFAIGVAGRYNFDSELRDSMFAGLGVSMADDGTNNSIRAHIQFGKRMAMSDTITWTPNLTYMMRVGGDIDEGSQIVINLLSFSGFM